MTKEEYMNKRVEHQINWYDKKSFRSKLAFIVLSISIIISGALIPFLAAYMDQSLCIKITIGILGVIVSVFSAMLPLLKLHENWLNYRTTAESLKSAKYLFEAYHEDELSFVKNVEAMISRRNALY